MNHRRIIMIFAAIVAAAGIYIIVQRYMNNHGQSDNVAIQSAHKSSAVQCGASGGCPAGYTQAACQCVSTSGTGSPVPCGASGKCPAGYKLAACQCKLNASKSA